MNSSINIAKNIARILFVLLTLNVVVALLLKTRSSSDAQAQNQEADRVVEKISTKNEPLEIAELRTKTKRVSLDQPFPSGDDWLEGMTFRLKNVSGKTLRRAELELIFPEIKLGNGTFLFTIHYGQIPDLPDPDSIEMPLVQTDETFELKFDDLTYATLRQRVFQGVSVTKVRMLISTAYFADGTAWRHGFWCRRDPNNPRRWLIIDQPSEQNAHQDRSKVRSLRHHAAYQDRSPLAGLLVSAQQ
jgi:hypothetical protein